MAVNWDMVGFVKRSKNRQNVLELLENSLTPSDVSKKLKMSLTHASKLIRELNTKGLVKCLNDNLAMGRIYKRTEKAKAILKYIKKI